jgi:hypothetical protein
MQAKKPPTDEWTKQSGNEEYPDCRVRDAFYPTVRENILASQKCKNTHVYSQAITEIRPLLWQTRFVGCTTMKPRLIGVYKNYGDSWLKRMNLLDELVRQFIQTCPQCIAD